MKVEGKNQQTAIFCRKSCLVNLKFRGIPFLWFSLVREIRDILGEYAEQCGHSGRAVASLKLVEVWWWLEYLTCQGVFSVFVSSSVVGSMRVDDLIWLSLCCKGNLKPSVGSYIAAEFSRHPPHVWVMCSRGHYNIPCLLALQL